MLAYCKTLGKQSSKRKPYWRRIPALIALIWCYSSRWSLIILLRRARAPPRDALSGVALLAGAASAGGAAQLWRAASGRHGDAHARVNAADSLRTVEFQPRGLLGGRAADGAPRRLRVDDASKVAQDAATITLRVGDARRDVYAAHNEHWKKSCGFWTTFREPATQVLI